LSVLRKHPHLYALAEVLAVFGSLVLLRAAVDGTTARLLFSAAILTATFAVIIAVFTAIIRWFRDRPAYVRRTRDFLVSSFLSTLDHSPLNPALIASNRARPDGHQN
jgi:hypothetical protein